jgi:hypothetical protein
MSKCLNSQETCTTDMVEIDVSKDVTILENTVLRLAGELGIALEDTSGISYVRALEGRRENIVLDYHHDFDGYQSFKAFKKGVRFGISKFQEGEYSIDLKNTGKELLEKAKSRIPKNEAEKKIYLCIIMSTKLRHAPEKTYEPVIDIKESELNLITAKTVLQYLS